MQFIAVDWSGAQDPARQGDALRLAESDGSRLTALERGMTRDRVADLLCDRVRSLESSVIGLDFAFSFPEWYLRHRNVSAVRDLWDLAAAEGEEWLQGSTWPFWGRPGPYQQRPADLPPNKRFRQTEAQLWEIGFNPKSVFQIAGEGQVGTGTIRGLPILARLRDAGAAIWPFDDPAQHTVVEIYPRTLGGELLTPTPDSRARYLAYKYPHLPPEWRREMEQSQDAFDAGVAALAMAARATDFPRLKRLTGIKALEGEIWVP